MEWRDPIEVEEENSLCHYGVKGMRWGHHKTSNIGSDINNILNAGKPKMGVNAGIQTAYKPKSAAQVGSTVITEKILVENDDKKELKAPMPSKNIIQQAAEFCSNIIKNIGNTLVSSISSLFKH